MSKRMLKNVICLILLTFISFQNVKADELSKQARATLDSFISCLNDGDSCVYDYFDNSNLEMYNNIQDYLNNINVRYQIKNISKKENNTYDVKTIIQAEGINWNVSGFSVNFSISNNDDEYIIKSTTLFDVVGSKNVTKFILKIFGIIGGIIGSIIVITIIIVLIVMRYKKKKKEIVTNL